MEIQTYHISHLMSMTIIGKLITDERLTISILFHNTLSYIMLE